MWLHSCTRLSSWNLSTNYVREKNTTKQSSFNYCEIFKQISRRSYLALVESVVIDDRNDVQVIFLGSLHSRTDINYMLYCAHHPMHTCNSSRTHSASW